MGGSRTNPAGEAASRVSLQAGQSLQIWGLKKTWPTGCFANAATWSIVSLLALPVSASAPIHIAVLARQGLVQPFFPVQSLSVPVAAYNKDACAHLHAPAVSASGIRIACRSPWLLFGPAGVHASVSAARLYQLQHYNLAPDSLFLAES